MRLLDERESASYFLKDVTGKKIDSCDRSAQGLNLRNEIRELNLIGDSLMN
jgi:hypothetical protein